LHVRQNAADAFAEQSRSAWCPPIAAPFEKPITASLPVHAAKMPREQIP
jgi:hypothetical protein